MIDEYSASRLIVCRVIELARQRSACVSRFHLTPANPEILLVVGEVKIIESRRPVFSDHIQLPGDNLKVEFWSATIPSHGLLSSLPQGLHPCQQATK
jgi:hypothetical protein